MLETLLSLSQAAPPSVQTPLQYRLQLLRAQGELPGAVDERHLQALAADMERVPGAWNVDARIDAVVEQLHIPGLGARMDALSGGQNRRVAIAAALIAQPTLLLLDEVTNHLSVDAIQYLESVLSDANVTVLAITHDRYFVDAVCDAIWELSEEGGLRCMRGGMTSI